MFIEIDDIGVDWQDAGAWRSYSLTTHGNSIQELMENAAISEVNQDGGEIDTYDIGNASYEVENRVIEIIAYEFTKACTECGDPKAKRCDCKECQDHSERWNKALKTRNFIETQKKEI